jgi:DNA-binding response OmpR family regulator
LWQLSLLKQYKVDLILSDLEMPNGDGLWLLLKLKALAESCPPIIILTGHPTITDAEVLDAGAIAVFRKPYCMKDLVQVVKNVGVNSGRK